MEHDSLRLIPQEQLASIARAFSDFAAACAKVVEALTACITPCIRALAAILSQPDDALLQQYATPKEWRIYKHTKKRRIKKKYRDRFVRRWTEQS